VARLDLDALGSRIETRAPVDDPVAARVEGDEADLGGKRIRQLAADARAALASVTAVAEQAGRSEATEQGERAGLKGDEWVHRARIDVRGPERHDPGHELRPANGEHPRVQPAATMPDDRDRLVLGDRQLLELAG
jgi:hypothetical protein